MSITEYSVNTSDLTTMTRIEMTSKSILHKNKKLYKYQQPPQQLLYLWDSQGLRERIVPDERMLVASR